MVLTAPPNLQRSLWGGLGVWEGWEKGWKKVWKWTLPVPGDAGGQVMVDARSWPGVRLGMSCDAGPLLLTLSQYCPDGLERAA